MAMVVSAMLRSGSRPLIATLSPARVTLAFSGSSHVSSPIPPHYVGLGGNMVDQAGILGAGSLYAS
ncbi:hypothetical protein A4G28_26845 [Mycobacterium ostraviense]|uniref:Uncharacterized protein n=1 Tax=Mycobacterium ostraviense TaxID=2738409 RepID=A0A162D6S1_9MYCO|nr:hypothetical protein A4G28_26845 [Mycobacterium ostraviense]